MKLALEPDTKRVANRETTMGFIPELRGIKQMPLQKASSFPCHSDLIEREYSSSSGSVFHDSLLNLGNYDADALFLYR